jgi:hypothetical protein
MKFIIATILTILLSFIAGLYLPWWGFAIAAFVVGLLVHQKAGRAFLAGFTSLFLLWFVLAWWQSSANNNILAGKIAQLLGIGNNATLLLVVTAFIAALVAGFAAMSGSFLRSKPVTR